MRSTRQELIELIRRGTDTAEALAVALGVTPSAVRAQLGALERDGVLERRGVRRLARAGKPAVVYGVTAAAEAGRSRAYAPVLVSLVTSLGETVPEAEMRGALADVIGLQQDAALRAPIFVEREDQVLEGQ